MCKSVSDEYLKTPSDILALFEKLFSQPSLCRGIQPLLGQCDAPLMLTGNFCAYKVGDHLGADAPPFRPLTHLRSRPLDGSNGDPL